MYITELKSVWRPSQTTAAVLCSEPCKVNMHSNTHTQISYSAKCACLCVFIRRLPDSVYSSVNLQTATHHSHSLLWLDPTLVKAGKGKKRTNDSVFQQGNSFFFLLSVQRQRYDTNIMAVIKKCLTPRAVAVNWAISSGYNSAGN